jgi:hypothetical protein
MSAGFGDQNSAVVGKKLVVYIPPQVVHFVADKGNSDYLTGQRLEETPEGNSTGRLMILHLQPIELILISHNEVDSCGVLITSQILPFLQLARKIRCMIRQTHCSD